MITECHVMDMVENRCHLNWMFESRMHACGRMAHPSGPRRPAVHPRVPSDMARRNEPLREVPDPGILDLGLNRILSLGLISDLFPTHFAAPWHPTHYTQVRST